MYNTLDEVFCSDLSVCRLRLNTFLELCQDEGLSYTKEQCSNAQLYTTYFLGKRIFALK